jgi:hypothetical protein
MRKAAALTVAAAALAGCGGSSNSPVAQVGGETVTRAQLDEAVDHFQLEAEAEGRSFPDRGTDAYRTVERQALGLLVYRSELLQSAEKLGVPVTDDEVRQRMQSSTESEVDTAFARDTVRAQLAYEHVYRHVTASATDPEAAMREWIAQMKESYKGRVSYEAGLGPGA